MGLKITISSDGFDTSELDFNEEEAMAIRNILEHSFDTFLRELNLVGFTAFGSLVAHVKTHVPGDTL